MIKRGLYKTFLLCVVVIVCIMVDSYLWLVKKLRGIIIFPGN